MSGAVVPQLIRGAYLWTSGMAINADGCPRCYAPPGSGLAPLDNLANAGRPGNWWGIACNNVGAPYVQGPDHAAPGYYVSTTALTDRSKPAGDPARYVDSDKVPYIVVPPDLTGQRGVHMGDVAMVMYKGTSCGALVADVGPRGKYGEGSMALARLVGIPDSPRHGGVADGVTFLVWPKTTCGWPRSITSFQAQAERAFAEFGGPAALRPSV